MSFILKALKKLEQEKAAREEVRVELSSAILTHDGKTGRKKRGGILLLAFSICIVAVIGLLYLKSGMTGKVAQLPPVTKVDSTPAKPLSSPQVEGSQPPVAEPKAPEETPAAPAPQASPVPAWVGQPGKRAAAKPYTSAEQPRKAAATEENGELNSPPAGITLTVSGIALQDDPSLSIAVVNGKIVKRGMSIDGYNVERIFLNKVRFSGNGGEFEIHMKK